ncbi:MAG: ATP-binding cassette domain-containing protein [Bacillus subtilis]|nr:ATP-binding cassette domain-containing protein [Bacillus subtilis]
MIKLVNVSKYYNTNGVVALGLRKVSLELHANEFVAIVGESGSGKTTLLNVICGIDSYEEGELFVNGEETSYFSSSDLEDYRKKYVAFVFQNYNLIDSYTVLQNVEAPMLLAGTPKREAKARALEIIRRVGLEKHVKHKATKLSGGQKQRVVIARALAKDCPIIAADEPTGNLDSDSSKQIMALLEEIAKDKLVIVVTHDFDQVRDYATRKIRIYDGEVVEDQSLKYVEPIDRLVAKEPSGKHKFWIEPSVAVRNLLAVPKKTFFMILVIAVFAFTLASVYGAFSNLIQGSQGSYNSFFNNTSPTRVVIKRYDNMAFTSEQIASYRTNPAVAAVVTNDFILDVSVSMVASEAVNDYEYYYLSGKYLPFEVAQASQLQIGRMPQNDQEMVLAVAMSSSYDLATFLDMKYVLNGRSSTNTLNLLNVVGVMYYDTIYMSSPDYGNSGAYFLVTSTTLDNARNLAYFQYATNNAFVGTNQLSQEVVFPTLLQGYDLAFEVDNSIPNNKIVITDIGGSFSNYHCGNATNDCILTGTYTISDYYETRALNAFTVHYDVVPYSDQYIERPVRLNAATLAAILPSDVFQISVLTKSDVGVDALVRQWDDNPLTGTFKAIYPFRSLQAFSIEQILMVFLRVLVTVIMVAVFTIALAIGYLIFRSVINSKARDYAILRTIGANEKALSTILYSENAMIAAFGTVLTIGMMIALPYIDPTSVQTLKYYGVFEYTILFLTIVLLSAMITRKYIRKVFRETLNKALRGE